MKEVLQSVIEKAIEVGSDAVAKRLKEFLETIELSQFYGINGPETKQIFKEIIIQGVEKFAKKIKDQ